MKTFCKRQEYLHDLKQILVNFPTASANYLFLASHPSALGDTRLENDSLLAGIDRFTL